MAVDEEEKDEAVNPLSMLGMLPAVGGALAQIIASPQRANLRQMQQSGVGSRAIGQLGDRLSRDQLSTAAMGQGATRGLGIAGATERGNQTIASSAPAMGMAAAREQALATQLLMGDDARRLGAGMQLGSALSGAAGAGAAINAARKDQGKGRFAPDEAAPEEFRAPSAFEMMYQDPATGLMSEPPPGSAADTIQTGNRELRDFQERKRASGVVPQGPPVETPTGRFARPGGPTGAMSPQSAEGGYTPDRGQQADNRMDAESRQEPGAGGGQARAKDGGAQPQYGITLADPSDDTVNQQVLQNSQQAIVDAQARRAQFAGDVLYTPEPVLGGTTPVYKGGLYMGEDKIMEQGPPAPEGPTPDQEQAVDAILKLVLSGAIDGPEAFLKLQDAGVTNVPAVLGWDRSSGWFNDWRMQ